MATVLESPAISEYLAEIQRLSVVADDLEVPKKYIAEQKAVFPTSPENTAFFDGEYAFYSKNYRHALVHYLKARTIPSFEFFCYRASAYVSFSRGEREKTSRFIDKALTIRPLDYPLLTLYHKVLMEKGENEKAKEIKGQMEKIKDEFSAKVPEEEKPMEEICETPTMTMEATNEFIATKLGVDLDMEDALEKRIRASHTLQSDLVQSYFEESKKERKIKNHALYMLSSRNERPPSQRKSNALISQLLLGEQLRRDSGGFFIRWNDYGIAINPGSDFLENFHDQGMYSKDITHVIVTGEAPEAYKDVKRIYDLNYHLNKINPELQVIHYYLNHKVYKELSSVLKPNFKQERNTVHSLELFLDSPDVEKEELGNEVTLNFFAISSRGGFMAGSDFKETPKTELTNSMGIRLDFKREGKPTKIGYISGAAWSPLIAHNLGSCDILITGFGNTNPNDYGKLNYNETTLGYFGTYTLLEEVKPRLLFCTEFDGREGDIRLEVTKKLRKEYETANSPSQSLPTILPADNGLFVDLESLRIECSVSKTLLDPKDVLVVKTTDTFGGLRYLSPKCLL